MSFEEKLVQLLKAAVMDDELECPYCGGRMYESDGPCQCCGKNALRDNGLI